MDCIIGLDKLCLFIVSEMPIRLKISKRALIVIIECWGGTSSLDGDVCSF